MKRQQCNQNLPYRILSSLERGPLTAVQVAMRVHADKSHVMREMRKLEQQQLVHHHGYFNTGLRGTKPRTWALGRGECVEPKPLSKMTAAERSAAWRARGGDGHRARNIQRQMARLPKAMTIAGMLGL